MAAHTNDNEVLAEIPVDRLPDEEIARRIISGDKDEFKILVQRHKDLVFSMLRRQITDHGIAEDLAQETFLRAYRNLGSFRGECRFSTWLVRIALNQVSSYFSSRRYKETEKTEFFRAQLHDAAISSQSDPSRQEERLFQRLTAGLAKLKQKFRDTLVLCALEGKSYEEAAIILQVPVGTVRSRLNKARRLMTEYFLKTEDS